jgi:hypothetical protein
MNVEFRPGPVAGDREIDVVFEGVPGVRTDLPSGVWLVPGGHDGWTLTFGVTKVGDLDAVLTWVRSATRAGFGVTDEHGEFTIAGATALRRAELDGQYHLTCNRFFASLEEARSWVTRNAEAIIDVYGAEQLPQ